MRRRQNRYAQTRRHKRKLKQKFMRNRCFHYGDNIRKLESDAAEKEIFINRGRNNGFEYWQICYLSGPRKFAKRSTNRAIRGKYRNLLSTADEESLEDIQGMRGADYEKSFDYAWTIW